MTPKEKAKELVNKFIRPTRLHDEILGWEDYIPSAKQCALIAVDEILRVSITYAGKDYEFYQEVKQEIEKL